MRGALCDLLAATPSTHPPHTLTTQVHLLEPVFHYYLRQEATPETWELRYVLLLWLSTIVLIPFNLATVDSNDLSDGLVDSMVGACQKALSDTGIVREGAAFLLSRLLTRPDTHQQLQRFLQWTLPVLEAGPGSTDVFLEVGVLLTLAHVLKHGQRHELLHHVDAMAAIILQQSEAGGTANTLRSKLLLKIAQRIGTTYLPARPVSWQYQRGNRSLVANLAQVHGTGAAGAPSSPMERGDAPQPHPDADDIDVPEQVSFRPAPEPVSPIAPFLLAPAPCGSGDAFVRSATSLCSGTLFQAPVCSVSLPQGTGG